MEPAQGLSLTQDNLVIGNLVIECPQQRTILLIASLLKDVSLQIHLAQDLSLHINDLICSSPFSRLMMAALWWIKKKNL